MDGLEDPKAQRARLMAKALSQHLSLHKTLNIYESWVLNNQLKHKPPRCCYHVVAQSFGTVLSRLAGASIAISHL